MALDLILQGLSVNKLLNQIELLLFLKGIDQLRNAGMLTQTSEGGHLCVKQPPRYLQKSPIAAGGPEVLDDTVGVVRMLQIHGNVGLAKAADP